MNGESGDRSRLIGSNAPDSRFTLSSGLHAEIIRQRRRPSSMEFGTPTAGPCQTLPPKVVMYMRSGFSGSGTTRCPHLKLYPEIRRHVSPRSPERHADDSKPQAYSTRGSCKSGVT